MPHKSLRKRFGYFSIKKGFVTEDQFIEAIRVQISNEQKGDESNSIGQIMKEMGYLTEEQIDEVINEIRNFERYKCPGCGMLLHECPNCGADLMKEGI
jgi:rRNA maturation endonuclease Nob1